MKKISILGATGSIGCAALDVVRQRPKNYQIVGLSAWRNISLLKRQIDEFHPEIVVVSDDKSAELLTKEYGNTLKIDIGDDGLTRLAVQPVDLVIIAVMGSAGIRPTMAAVKSGVCVGLANKESMVMSGKLIMQQAKESGSLILPIDSEHNAIFQMIHHVCKESIRLMTLTASGGPFLDYSQNDLAHVRVEDALKHPNWKMGDEITIDSATLMNKGLEMIEARWLFDVHPDTIDVVVHKESVIHSFVTFSDSSVMAQMYVPDMRIPISYVVDYPNRSPTMFRPLEISTLSELHFKKPEEETFRCLMLAKQALSASESSQIVVCSANEVCRRAFLDQKIEFLEIPTMIEKTLEHHTTHDIRTMDDVFIVANWARSFTNELVNRGKL